MTSDVKKLIGVLLAGTLAAGPRRSTTRGTPRSREAGCSKPPARPRRRPMRL